MENITDSEPSDNNLDNPNDSNTTVETEIVIYSEIGDMSGLDLADSKETHFQLESNFDNGNRCRVRKSIRNETVDYIFTIKVIDKNSEISKCEELNKEVDEEFFKTFFKVSDRIIQKYRYTFNKDIKINAEGKEIIVPNIKYEVDVFFKKGYGIKGCVISDWCKIDIEIDKINEYLESNYPDLKDIKLSVSISELPFKPKKSILSSDCTDMKKQKIKELWDNQFITLKEETMTLE